MNAPMEPIQVGDFRVTVEHISDDGREQLVVADLDPNAVEQMLEDYHSDEWERPEPLAHLINIIQTRLEMRRAAEADVSDDEINRLLESGE